MAKPAWRGRNADVSCAFRPFARGLLRQTDDGQVNNQIRRERIVYAVLLAATAGWLSAIIAAPALLARGHITTALTLYQTFSVICHQLPARSLNWHEFPLGVCSRCTGIYAGFAVGLLIYPLVRDLREMRFPPRALLLSALLPMTLDVLVDWAGLRANTFFSRSATGALLGAVLAFYILPGLVETFCARNNATGSSSMAATTNPNPQQRIHT